MLLWRTPFLASTHFRLLVAQTGPFSTTFQRSYSMELNNSRDSVTQGDELVNFYGNGTASAYADMMDEEVKKTIPDLKLLLTIFPEEGLILDTCVGSGHMLRWIHENHGSQKTRELKGIDISSEMLEQARARLPGSMASLVLGNMLDMSSQADESCAAVINTFALHHATAKECKTAIQEWTRILKPGGCLYVGAWEGKGNIDYGDHSPGFKAALHQQTDIIDWMTESGLTIVQSRTHMEEEMGMNSFYVVAKKPKN